jgi:uncharacterized membrane protein YhiD involved in acid resistance
VQDFFFDQLIRYEAGPSWQLVLLCVLISFLLCQMIATVYVWTFTGLSYSRSFVISQVMGGLVTTILLLAIGNNVARGLGLLGTLSLIRFRSNLKDTRDMVFVFGSLAIGVAVGVQAFTVAVVGTLAFCAAALYLGFSVFGSRRQFDGLLRFQAPSSPEADRLSKAVLKQYCTNFTLINLREVAQGRFVEHAYQVKLRDTSYNEPLVAALRAVPGVDGVSLLMQDQTMEV